MYTSSIADDTAYEDSVFRMLIDSQRWTYTVSLQTNLTFNGKPGQYRNICKNVHKFHQRIEEKLIRHPERRDMLDRNVWMLRAAISPKGKIHFHGVTDAPPGKPKTKMLVLIHHYWPKMFANGSTRCKILYDSEEWGNYDTYGQSAGFAMFQINPQLEAQMKEYIILPERRT